MLLLLLHTVHQFRKTIKISQQTLVLDCPTELMAKNCRTFSEIPAQACDQGETTTDAGLVRPLPYVTLEDVLSTTTTQASTTTAASDEYTTTAAYGDEKPASEAPAQEDATVVVVTDSYNRADDESEEEEVAGYEQKCTPGSRASTVFCVKNYLECTATGYVEKSCRVGKLFDSNSSRCVARIACGKEAIRDAIKDRLRVKLNK
ncbi:hypothetical protein B9Z55_002849 [Caenorhabditis nigoni]|nr:hypothetical protein B9Z55_002849 [Caenorhabditis nigoni]